VTEYAQLKLGNIRVIFPNFQITRVEKNIKGNITKGKDNKDNKDNSLHLTVKN